MSEKGKFIVIEGCEGAGKSTQIAELKKEFGDTVITTREPGGSAFAEIIRNIILSPSAKDADGKTQFGLFWAARADHMRNTIIPALCAGTHVICDRFDSSSYIYQIYGQEDLALKDLFFKMREVYLGEYEPDLYIFLDVDPEEGLRRKANQKGVVLNHFDQRDLSFHERVRSGLLEFFQAVPCSRVDANLPYENVRENLVSIINDIVKQCQSLPLK